MSTIRIPTCRKHPVVSLGQVITKGSGQGRRTVARERAPITLTPAHQLALVNGHIQIVRTQEAG